MKLAIDNIFGTITVRRPIRQHAVYIATSTNGEILYIGKSTSGLKRIGHSVGKRLEEKNSSDVLESVVYTISLEESKTELDLRYLEGLLISAHQLQHDGRKPRLNEMAVPVQPRDSDMDAARAILEEISRRARGES